MSCKEAFVDERLLNAVLVFTADRLVEPRTAHLALVTWENVGRRDWACVGRQDAHREDDHQQGQSGGTHFRVFR